MSNCCTDMVVFYFETDNKKEQLENLAKAIFHCYPACFSRSNTGISILLDYLGIKKEGLYIRGDVIFYEFKKNSLHLEVYAAWRPLYYCYQAIAEHFGLEFVMQSEEPGCSIFINTDIFGEYFPARYRVYLPHETNAFGTVYEKLYQNESGPEWYLSSAKDLLIFFASNGISAEDIPQLLSMLDDDYVKLNTYDTTFE